MTASARALFDAVVDALGTFDDRVRLAVYTSFLEHAAPPTAADVAGALGTSLEETEAAFRRLADGPVLVLAPGRLTKRRSTPEEAEATFAAIGLTGDFWSPRTP